MLFTMRGLLHFVNILVVSTNSNNLQCLISIVFKVKRQQAEDIESLEGTSCLNSVVYWETVEADLVKIWQSHPYDGENGCFKILWILIRRGIYIITSIPSWQNTGAWGTPCTRKRFLNSLNDINPTLKTNVNKIIGISNILPATFILLHMVTYRIAKCTQQVGGITETKYLVGHLCLYAIWKLKTCCV